MIKVIHIIYEHTILRNFKDSTRSSALAMRDVIANQQNVSSATIHNFSMAESLYRKNSDRTCPEIFGFMHSLSAYGGNISGEAFNEYDLIINHSWGAAPILNWLGYDFWTVAHVHHESSPDAKNLLDFEKYAKKVIIADKYQEYLFPDAKIAIWAWPSGIASPTEGFNWNKRGTAWVGRDDAGKRAEMLVAWVQHLTPIQRSQFSPITVHFETQPRDGIRMSLEQRDVDVIVGQDAETSIKKCKYYLSTSFGEGCPRTVVSAAIYGATLLLPKERAWAHTFPYAQDMWVHPEFKPHNAEVLTEQRQNALSRFSIDGIIQNQQAKDFLRTALPNA